MSEKNDKLYIINLKNFQFRFEKLNLPIKEDIFLAGYPSQRLQI